MFGGFPIYFQNIIGKNNKEICQKLRLVPIIPGGGGGGDSGPSWTGCVNTVF